MPAAIVDSSWIDMLAGLANPGICRMPPGFCANAVPATSAAASSAPTITDDRSLPVIGRHPSLLSPHAAAEVITGPVAPATRKGDKLPPEIVMKVNSCCICSKSAANALPLVASSLFAGPARARQKGIRTKRLRFLGFGFGKQQRAARIRQSATTGIGGGSNDTAWGIQPVYVL